MRPKTKYFLADLFLGLAFIFGFYVVGGLSYVYVQMAMDPSIVGDSEPWIWFGDLVFLPLVALIYAVLFGIIITVLYNKAVKSLKEYDGTEYTRIERPIFGLKDFWIVGAFLIFSPYLAMQLYPVLEGTSDTTMIVLSLVPVITCIAVIAFWRKASHWIDDMVLRRRNAKEARQ